MLPEHSMVIVTRDIPDQGVRHGDVGAIVHVYPGAAAYEVEFERIEGKSVPLATLKPDDVRLATSREIELAADKTHAAK